MLVHKTALLSAITTALLASASLQAAEPLKAVGAGEGQLDIVAWPGYIERGETDKTYDWVTGFEKETGCKVNVKTAGTSDEMVSLMAKGGYDLVTASGDASLRLIAGKRVQPINTALIPNWKNLDPRLKDAPWYVVNNQTYGTPYQWGPNVLMYNTKVFTQPPTSWGVLFEEQKLSDGKSNKGRVQAYDGPIYIADAALYLKTAKPELGITDPYLLDEKQYKAVLDLLRAQQKLIHRYWHDTTVQMSDFKNEGVVASSSWPYQVNGLHLAELPGNVGELDCKRHGALLRKGEDHHSGLAWTSEIFIDDRSHAPRGNAARDALRQLCANGRGASVDAFPRRAWERSVGVSDHP